MEWALLEVGFEGGEGVGEGNPHFECEIEFGGIQVSQRIMTARSIKQSEDGLRVVVMVRDF